ncbi:MAG: diguanylate phosphodiesterase, partial [Ilumatobacteraceae bacterium]|nr:diguanylate phosphodiesterase [Ilumatobacteraceae bacterium]
MSMDASQEQLVVDRDRALIARVLGGHLTSAYQPIVDLDRGAVLGFEALVRYRSGSPTASPELFSATDLFDSARRIGRTEEIEAAALTAALQARSQLPRDCLLFLNVSTSSLTDERVDRVLRAQGSLEGVVLELNDPGVDLDDDARDAIELFRDRGSVIAVVDPFLDPVRLDAMMLAEPGFFKLNRQMIAGVSGSNTKLAIVDSVRHLAERLGVGVIAQGIEDLADLRSL